MANVLVEETSLEDIADAIRSKNGLTTKYKPAEMADAITAISGGGITPTGTKTINITQNGTVTEDVTNYANAQVNVNVPQGITPTGTKQVPITQNGTVTEDVTNYASAEISVNVPNSYSASDEGKVVSNGALVAQTSRQITSNGTVDTTLNDEVVVNVPTGITPSGSQEFTQNGTYDVSSLAEAVVNVASSGGGGSTRFITTASYSHTTGLSNAIKSATGFESFVAKNLSPQPDEGYYFVGYSTIKFDDRTDQPVTFRVSSNGSYGILGGNNSISTPLPVGTELLVIEVAGI